MMPGTEKGTINISLMNIDSANQMSYFDNYFEGENQKTKQKKKNVFLSGKLPNCKRLTMFRSKYLQNPVT